MAIDSNLIKLAVDGYKGHVAGDYSVNDTQEALRKALVEANGGSTKLDIKAIRDGRCNGVFAIIEELVNVIHEEGLKGDEFFMNMVEDRNLSLGDTNKFHIERECLFAVADIAEGTQGVRRQRIEAGQDITINTQLRAIKIYEELNRILAGRIDFNKFVDLVGKSFTKQELDATYDAFVGMFKKLKTPYTETGSFDEDKLLELIDHIEASTGETAVVVGTRKALRKIKTAVVSDSAKEEMYAMGHFGRFNGTELVAVKQRHKSGTDDFILDDNVLYVFAGDTKPIKRVTEGDVTMLMGTPMNNADMSQEFLMMKRTGIAVIFDRDFGVYNLSE
nr:MAG TPA: capsid protein [Caudoviricetes sp.]